ncbi:bifunctional diguanylate cyclase/phosphodiesterase [Pararhizobium gei]|uniref:bifunctional diguanylate cyclase/phosphodiesterase n=1 Tax=Pararhizobium gei TaxID=1395951 RepID=UPI0023DCDAB3|nr:EAL domain-containing protein [Rhizobium gei]
MNKSVTFSERVLALARAAKPSLFPAVIAAGVVFTGGYFFKEQSRKNFQSELTSSVRSELHLIATRLQSEINGNITALRGFANNFSIRTDMPQPVFERLATKLLLQNPQMARISIAPNAVVQRTFPLAGNEGIMGMDFKRFPSSRVATDRAQSKAKPIISGPVQLPSGRTGFNLFSPVFVRDGGTVAFWGFIEAAIDEKEIYRAAHLPGATGREFDADMEPPASRIQLAIRDISVKDGIQDAFYGDTDLFEQSPVIRQLHLPGGNWELAAAPAGGWLSQSTPSGWLDFIILVSAAIVVIPIFLTSRLVNERQRNMAALRSRERELLTLSHRLNLALESSKIGIWEIDLDSQQRSWDERMYHIHGMQPGDGAPTYADWRRTLHPDDTAGASRTLFKALDENLDYRSQYRIVMPDGRVRHVRNVGSTYTGAEGQAKITGISWDVTDDVLMNEQLRTAKALADQKNAELAEAKDRIEHNALHDPLTGLGNRRMLDSKLEALCSVRKGSLENIAILHIDLDRFKQINDTLGHAAGDAMLVHASKILRSNVRAGDVVARIGGDEFVVLVIDPPSKELLSSLSERIIVEMRQPVDYNGFPCRFGVSIGIAIANDLTTDERQLLINADIALYRAKENGRNRHEFFTEALQSEIITTKRIADEILEGIETNQFTAWYQPQFEAGSLRLSGVEALIRWNHPREGVLTPDRFLAIAEELNVVATLDRIVLERALFDGMRWAAAGIDVPKISVNVSAKRLSDDTLLNSLRGLSFKPGQLSFELVESIFLDDGDDIVIANIEGIKKLGIDIEIDDFGTGHTSIVSLLKIKPKRLKIDRQLVGPILQARSEQALIRSIIEIGRSLGIETVAEGVETMAHAEMLAVLGCDLLQGYAFAKPLSFDKFVVFARTDALKLAS